MACNKPRWYCSPQLQRQKSADECLTISACVAALSFSLSWRLFFTFSSSSYTSAQASPAHLMHTQTAASRLLVLLHSHTKRYIHTLSYTFLFTFSSSRLFCSSLSRSPSLIFSSFPSLSLFYNQQTHYTYTHTHMHTHTHTCTHTRAHAHTHTHTEGTPLSLHLLPHKLVQETLIPKRVVNIGVALEGSRGGGQEEYQHVQ